MGLHSACDDSIYEIANDIFDSVVFSSEHDLKLYNDEPTDRLRDELYEIIGMMIGDAEEAMYRCAYAKRDDFLEMVREGDGEEQ